ncbi:hypothetical protein C8A00DRAFT_16796 [Chaetomidium leptoderma]|uniref:Uncharacterized protein n=1 Tax=Chaetomidium leptoderma TaxID=669021 RepID=A0AAN6VJ82_9PEZI|nr:hypothetical protein C8A00DRAFT_16796 [Chaetomidium leptoderma]
MYQVRRISNPLTAVVSLTSGFGSECKAPAEHAPAGWNRLMSQTAGRLRAAHPNRMLFAILAVGLEWMISQRNPQNQQSPLLVLAHNQAEVWPVDPYRETCVAPIAGQVPLLRSITPNGQHEIIDTYAAYSLDYHGHDWATAP